MSPKAGRQLSLAGEIGVSFGGAALVAGRAQPVSWGPVLALWLSTLLIWTLGRLLGPPLAAAARRTARRRGKCVLVAGVGPLGRHTGLDLRDSRRRRLCGYLQFAGQTVDPRLPAPVLGTVTALPELLAECVVDEVFLASSSPSHRRETQAAIAVLERSGVAFALPVGKGFRYVRARPAESKRVFGDGYIHFSMAPAQRLERMLKRLLDVTVAALALVLLSPVFVVAALLVAFTDGGSVLVAEERVGVRGCVFPMLRFGPLGTYVGPVTAQAQVIALLPRLINVLFGDMSIVGPRPATRSEVALHEPWQRRRLSVRPGVIGPIQDGASGKEAISLEVAYVDHWSLAEDARLALKATVRRLRPSARNDAQRAAVIIDAESARSASASDLTPSFEED